MAPYYFSKKRINTFKIPHTFDVNKIQLGVPVEGNEAEKVGLKEVGDTVLPSGSFGIVSRRNAYGYTYADKTKPKENRYVSTIWVYPFGNLNASKMAVDICKDCYQRKDVDPYEIELMLFENNSKQRFVIVNMTEEIRRKYLKHAVNMMLEIYGRCYVYDEEIKISKPLETKRCNWEILPPGEMPSLRIRKMLRLQNKDADTFDTARLDYIETFNAKSKIEGRNGFNGYYAYLFDNYCVLESAFYGNATYVIPAENWESLSQKTKHDLINEKVVISKIVHTSDWCGNLNSKFSELGISKK